MRLVIILLEYVCEYYSSKIRSSSSSADPALFVADHAQITSQYLTGIKNKVCYYRYIVIYLYSLKHIK